MTAHPLPHDKPSRAEVLDWLERQLGQSLSPAAQSDILQATGREGAQAEALMAGFAARFGVDLTGFRPRMHARAEAQVLRPGWPFAIPAPHGAAVPLSVSLLHAAATLGHWPVRYPVLPPARDLSAANLPLLAAGLVGATLLVLWAVPRLL